MKIKNIYQMTLIAFIKYAYTEVLNQHTPQKKKSIWEDNKPFMNKTLSQAIIQRTKLRNKFLKDSNNHDKHL